MNFYKLIITLCFSLYCLVISAQDFPVFVEVESGFSQPVGIVNAGDNSDRIFVVERQGVIKILDANRNTLPNPFLDISTVVDASGGEEGLLGLVFHPNYEANGYFYVNYIFDTGVNNMDVTRISRFNVNSSNVNQADANSEYILLEIPQPQNNHNAGDMHFGADGYLYITSGDGGGGGDPQGNGQNLNTLLGSILRIDVDNQSAQLNYAIPADNPFINDPNARNEIWLYGLRNPWRMSFDPANGDLYIADVGQRAREEVSIVSTGQGGLNLGWNCREGLIPYDSDLPCNGTYHDPVFDYPRTDGRSITGGHVYRGSEMPEFEGWYFAIDYVTNKLFKYKDQQVFKMTVPNVRNVTSFARSENGEIYASSIRNGTGNNFNGTIYKLEREVCPPQLYVATHTGQNYLADEMITSDATISGGTQIFYGSPTVELLSGFCVQTDSQLEIQNINCDTQ